jgi:hypothetical protein
MQRRCAILAAVSLLLLAGCSSSRETSTPALHPGYATSRDGLLHYRPPVGWFDATADSQAMIHAVWLLRSDYSASITVDRIRLDANAQSSLGSSPLLTVAQLTMGLSAGERAPIVREAPSLFTAGGRQFCRYKLEYEPSRDAVSVVLLNAGGAVYSVTALVTGERRADERALQDLQLSFVTSLRW